MCCSCLEHNEKKKSVNLKSSKFRSTESRKNDSQLIWEDMTCTLNYKMRVKPAINGPCSQRSRNWHLQPKFHAWTVLCWNSAVLSDHLVIATSDRGICMRWFHGDLGCPAWTILKRIAKSRWMGLILWPKRPGYQIFLWTLVHWSSFAAASFAGYWGLPV